MYGGILILVASDAAFAHLLVRTHVVMREVLLAEQYIETHSEDPDGYEYEGYEEYFHLEDKIAADGFVVINLADDACEYLSH